jgi:hypothetical protein
MYSGHRILSLTGSLSMAALASVVPGSALAHGFAQRYDLPVPLDLYLAGAGAAVALSFVVIALFQRGAHSVSHYPRLNLLANPIGRILASNWVVQPLKIFSVACLALFITAGFFGDENPFKNIAPTAIWVIWWVGFAYISGLLGNLWSVVNPWAASWQWLERAWQGITGSPLRPIFQYPERLGQLPGLLLFVWFVWAELIWTESDHPADLARVALVYSLLTWVGCLLFGRLAWLRNGEVFAIVLGYLARFSPTEIRVTDNEICRACDARNCRDQHAGCVDCQACFEQASGAAREWNLRPWAVGLLTAAPLPAAATSLVLVMLASVTFDGLLSTPLWTDVSSWMIHSADVRPIIVFLQEITGDALSAMGTIALVVFLVAFRFLYLAFCGLMALFTPAHNRQGVTLGQISGCFVLSLVPIALAYHLAHYLSYLAIVGQYIIPLASDPYGFGWNLFGTGLYFVDISVINARFVWITSVVAIVVGHIVAVWLSHVMALRVFGDRRAALLSQVPMLLLMVAYTVLSLWILAQPVVNQT